MLGLKSEFILKEKLSLATVPSYTLFISCATNVIEERQVLMCDTQGAFLTKIGKKQINI